MLVFSCFLPRRKVYDINSLAQEDNTYMEMQMLSLFYLLTFFSFLCTFFAFYLDVRFLTLRRTISTWKCKCCSLMGARWFWFRV